MPRPPAPGCAHQHARALLFQLTETTASPGSCSSTALSPEPTSSLTTASRPMLTSCSLELWASRPATLVSPSHSMPPTPLPTIPTSGTATRTNLASRTSLLPPTLTTKRPSPLSQTQSQHSREILRTLSTAMVFAIQASSTTSRASIAALLPRTALTVSPRSLPVTLSAWESSS